MSNVKCSDCGAVLEVVSFSRPLTVEECGMDRQHLFGSVRPPLCEPCWKKAYKARFGKEWTR